MTDFFQKIISFFMTILAFFGVAVSVPVAQEDIGKNMEIISQNIENGCYFTTQNDKNITSIKYNNVEKYAYEYNDGVLSKSVDYDNMLVAYYTDDTITTKTFTLSGSDIFVL